jgi:hypothetical protein
MLYTIVFYQILITIVVWNIRSILNPANTKARTAVV